MADKEFEIRITVKGGDPKAKITTSNGDEFIVSGLALFGDTEGSGNLLTFFWNRPSMAAKAVVRGCACAINRGDEVAKQFYRCILRGFCEATGIKPERNEVEAEDILKRWDEDLKITVH